MVRLLNSEKESKMWNEETSDYEPSDWELMNEFYRRVNK